MSVRTGRLGNASIKKESTWGEFITPDLLLRVISESNGRAVEHAEDNALVGEIYPTDLVKVADGSAGSLEGNIHGDEIGMLMHGVLGGEETPEDPIDANIIVSYNGTASYARLSVVVTDLIAEISTDGISWTPDTDFATTGTMDLSSAPFDTAGEVATATDGFTGYSATLFGKASSDSVNATAFAITNLKAAGIKVGSINIKYQVVASTLAKTHILSPADAAVLLPSFTLLVNRVLGTDKSVAFTGTKFQSITIANSNKDLTKFSIPVTSKEELVDQTDVDLSVSDVQAFTSAKMKILVVKADGTQVLMEEVKDHSLVINTNIDENRVIGSLNIKEQIRQNSTIELSYTANNTDSQYVLRDEYINDAAVETFLYWESNSIVDSDESIPYSFLVRIPSTKYTDFNSPLTTGDRLTISAAGKTVKPTNDVYTKHIEFLIVDGELTAY
jgi:hypothetical protein